MKFEYQIQEIVNRINDKYRLHLSVYEKEALDDILVDIYEDFKEVDITDTILNEDSFKLIQRNQDRLIRFAVRRYNGDIKEFLFTSTLMVCRLLLKNQKK